MHSDHKVYPSRQLRRQIFPALMVLMTVWGCGGEHRARQGHVAGTVTLNGAALTSGQVSFFSAESGIGGMSPINGEGHYEINGLNAPGDYQITVTPQEPTPGGPAVPPSDLPAKYSSATTSGLSFSLKPGNNTFPIELKK